MSSIYPSWGFSQTAHKEIAILAVPQKADICAHLSSIHKHATNYLQSRHVTDSAFQVPGLEKAILLQLLPRDEADDRDVILEVRAGTGGSEASLFAGDLFRMYNRFAQLRGWRFEPVEASHLYATNFSCPCQICRTFASLAV